MAPVNMGGAILLTGCSKPYCLRWPMSLFEYGKSNGLVSLQGLFDGNFSPAETDTSIKDMSTKTLKAFCALALKASAISVRAVYNHHAKQPLKAQKASIYPNT